VMHVGADDWPLFDVHDSGADVVFSLVIPGTPYTTIRYAGTITGGMLQLAGLDADQGVYHLTARRATALPAPRVALLNPPPAAKPEEARVAPSGPPAKLPLPPLRDVPPNNLAKTPPMGWASRQKLGSDIEDDDIRQAAESLEETDLRSKGYIYVEVGDGWQGTRDANGVLHAGAKFPDMKALADYVHSKQVKLGLTVSAAPKSCGGFEGSYGHEAGDAKLFAAWGIDYIVYDWCGADSIYPTQAEQRAAYQQMGEALRASGRDIAFGMSQNGAFDVASWGAKTGANLWRTGPDIQDKWDSITQAGFGQNGKEANAGPGRWNDPGLLQVGNSAMTPDEYRTQLNLWAVLAAPMMLGNDVRIMTKETLATLSNQELIAIDQDPLGRQAKRVAQNGQSEVWARPLADGSMAVAFFNRGQDSAPVTVSWQQLGIDGPRRVRDVWRHEDSGTANGRYAVFLSPHTSLLLRMSR
jgi:alpha-galactosidase